MSIASGTVTTTPQGNGVTMAVVTAELQNLRNDIVALAKALMTLQQRVADSEVSTTEVRPQLVALKVHSESIPQALRELRRGDAALQKKLDALETRVRGLEEKTREAVVRA